jgi:hypothetical protein
LQIGFDGSDTEIERRFEAGQRILGAQRPGPAVTLDFERLVHKRKKIPCRELRHGKV